jgi:hypothetical protein
MKATSHRKIRPKVGDVIQIALPDGRYAYGRIYKDASVGIYRQVTNEPDQPPVGSRDFMFNVGIYDDIVTSGECPIVGHDPFKDSESSWPAPNCIIDPISGEYSIYHKGEIRAASEVECEGLEEAAVWDLQHIISRIMNGLTQN